MDLALQSWKPGGCELVESLRDAAGCVGSVGRSRQAESGLWSHQGRRYRDVCEGRLLKEYVAGEE